MCHRVITQRFPNVDFLCIEFDYEVILYSTTLKKDEIHSRTNGKKLFSSLDNKLRMGIPIPRSAIKGKSWCKVLLTGSRWIIFSVPYL